VERKDFAKAVIIIGALFILLSVFIIIRENTSTPTGRIISDINPPAKDAVSIKSSELVKCCTFRNDLGKDDSCFVLKRYDCSYCASYCKK
jgi:hypothetical protein